MKRQRFFPINFQISFSHLSGYAVLIIVCFYFLTNYVFSVPLNLPFDVEILSDSQLRSLFQEVQNDAKQQIISSYGQSQFDLLKQNILQKYPHSQYPFPLNQDDWGVESNKIKNQAGAYFIVGMEAALKGHPLFAKWCFANASLLAPTCPIYLCNLAFTLNLEGDYHKARILLNHAKNLSPSMSSIWINLGYGYQKQNNYDKASESFLIAFALDPFNDEYRDMVIDALEKKGDTQTANIIKVDQALELLKEEGKEKESSVKLPPRGERKNWAESKKRSGLSNKSNEMVAAYFRPGLLTAINNFEQEAKWHKQKSKEYPTGSKLWNIHQLGCTSWLMMADICKGSLNKLTGEWYSSETSDWIAREARGDLEDLNKPKPAYNLWTFWVGPISIGEDSDGTYKLGISAGILGAEFSVNPSNYNVGVKASLGPNLKFGVGPVAAGAEVGAYFYCDLKNGPEIGTVSADSISLFGQKLEAKTEKKLGSLSLENILN